MASKDQLKERLIEYQDTFHRCELSITALRKRNGHLAVALDEVIEKYIPEDDRAMYRNVLEGTGSGDYNIYNNCEKLVDHAIKGNMEDVAMYAERIKHTIPQLLAYKKKMSEDASARAERARTARQKAKA